MKQEPEMKKGEENHDITDRKIDFTKMGGNRC